MRQNHHPAMMPVSYKGDNPPLFCIYGEPLKLALALCKKRPVYSLNTAYQTGCNSDVPKDIGEVARTYINAIRSVQPSGPYFLYGHCSGATIAYEVARQLIIDSQDVSRIFLLEPSLKRSSTKKTALLMAQAMIKDGFSIVRLKSLVSIFGTLIRWLPGVIRNRTRLLWHSAAKSLPPEALRFQNHLEKIVPSVRSYTYGELNCPVSVICRNIDNEQMLKYKKLWAQVTGNEVNVHSVKASTGHLDVLEDAPIKLVAAVIDHSIGE